MFHSPQELNMNLNHMVVMVVMVITYMQHLPIASFQFQTHNINWETPPKGKERGYQKWAYNTKFYVGDVLQFAWSPGKNGNHTVVEVSSKLVLDACNTSAIMAKDVRKESPAIFSLGKEGFHGFMCTLHCKSGNDPNRAHPFGDVPASFCLDSKLLRKIIHQIK
ncbi:putative Phytocyanin domain, cupredoxin [Helianthus annuus]|nr:putative Phytocyanin domain, cupredoxin [Helianthus annuus]